MCFKASSYVGGGRSQRPLKVVPKKEKNLEEPLKEPVGLPTVLSSAKDDLTDH